jgi:hypothetical protein
MSSLDKMGRRPPPSVPTARQVNVALNDQSSRDLATIKKHLSSQLGSNCSDQQAIRWAVNVAVSAIAISCGELTRTDAQPASQPQTEGPDTPSPTP